jgi:hypothetical protein
VGVVAHTCNNSILEAKEGVEASLSYIASLCLRKQSIENKKK